MIISNVDFKISFKQEHLHISIDFYSMLVFFINKAET